MRDKVVITPSGTTGSASGSGTLFLRFGPQSGALSAVYIKYAASITSTTDVTLTSRDPAVTFLTVSNNTASGWYFPRAQVVSNTAASYTAYTKYPFDAPVVVNVASSSPVTDAVTVYGYA